MALNSTVSQIINRAITNFNNIRSALITMNVDVSSMDSDDYADAIINNVVKNKTLTITPTTEEQIINVPSGYTGFGDITVEAVDSSIDSDIQPQNIKSGVNILGVDGTAIEKLPNYNISMSELAVLLSDNKCRCVFDYNGKLELINKVGHYEYDIENDSWSTILASSSIMDRDNYNGQYNCGWLFGDKVVFVNTLDTGSGQYVKVREYDMTTNTASNRTGGTLSGSVYPISAVEHKGYIYASYSNSGKKIAKIDVSNLTYTVVANTTNEYRQLVFYKDELYGISSTKKLDKIDIINDNVTEIGNIGQDDVTLLGTSDYLFAFGMGSSYNQVYYYDGTNFVQYDTLDYYSRNNVNYIYNGIAYQIGGMKNYTQYGTMFRKYGTRFFKELDIRPSTGDEINTEFVTKINII